MCVVCVCVYVCYCPSPARYVCGEPSPNLPIYHMCEMAYIYGTPANHCLVGAVQFETQPFALCTQGLFNVGHIYVWFPNSIDIGIKQVV